MHREGPQRGRNGKIPAGSRVTVAKGTTVGYSGKGSQQEYVAGLSDIRVTGPGQETPREVSVTPEGPVADVCYPCLKCSSYLSLVLCQARYHVHLMVKGRNANAASARTAWRKVSVTITIPVTDICYAFATDVCYAHPKCSSSLACVGRTHSIVRLQTKIHRKDGSENFGGFV